MYEIFEKLLKQFNVSTYQVSKATGISQSTFSNWKSRRNLISTEKGKLIAEYFGISLDYLMTGKENISDTSNEPQFNKKDERDIKKDLETIMNKLESGEDGPASFDGEAIPEDDREMFAAQLEIMLRRLKLINKEKYNPHKNKK